MLDFALERLFSIDYQGGNQSRGGIMVMMGTLSVARELGSHMVHNSPLMILSGVV